MTGHPGIDRFRGALVGAVLGDCLGAPFEGQPGPIPSSEVYDVLADGTTLRFTDDTAMTMALTESLLERGGVDEDHLAATWARHFTREPWRGYGAGTGDLLRRVAAGDDWRQASAGQFGGSGSFGNGAAMRVAPVGLLTGGDAEAAASLARRSAAPTHAHPAAADGAAVVAAAVATLSVATGPDAVDPVGLVAALAPHAGDDELRRRLDDVRLAAGEGDLTPEYVRDEIGTGVRAVESVPAAVACVAAHPGSLPRAVMMAICVGGDTDTIASMTGAMAGALHGDRALPPAWLARMEGVEQMGDLAGRLHRWLGWSAPRRPEP